MDSDSESTSPTTSSPLEISQDALYVILSQLDAFALARVSRVSKTWRLAAAVETHWSELSKRRWKLKEKKDGKYKYGERSWREVFRVFHRRNRMPNVEGTSMREVVYSSGRANRVCCWLLVNHLPACRLVARATPPSKLLCARIVLQNLRDDHVTVNPAKDLSITLRDGSVSNALAPCGDEWATCDDAHGAVELAPLEAVVLTDISFPMPHTMNYEPDVLEACREMLCRVSPASTAEPLWVPCAFATESKIWEHYEEITRDFYVHVDAEE